jgi:hypothetical protein
MYGIQRNGSHEFKREVQFYRISRTLEEHGRKHCQISKALKRSVGCPAASVVSDEADGYS